LQESKNILITYMEKIIRMVCGRNFFEIIRGFS